MFELIQSTTDFPTSHQQGEGREGIKISWLKQRALKVLLPLTCMCVHPDHCKNVSQNHWMFARNKKFNILKYNKINVYRDCIYYNKREQFTELI